MQLEELLEAEGLDADATQRTLDWARARAAEIVANMPEGLELSSLLEDLPSFDAKAGSNGAARPTRPDSESSAAAPVQELEDESSIDIAAEVEAGADVGLPPPPDHHDDLGDAPDMLAGVPDTGSLETLHSAEIEMLDDDELELVEEDEELDEEESTATVRSVESGAPEPVDASADEPVAAAPDAAVDDDISVDLDVDLSDLDDL